MQIVLAKAEKTRLVETGRMIRPDGVNYRPEFTTDWEAKALMWLRNGSAKDLTKAERYAAKEGWMVYTYDPAEKDPLGKAKAAILRE